MHTTELELGGATATLTGYVQLTEPGEISLAGIAMLVPQEAGISLQAGQLVNIHATWRPSTSRWHAQTVLTLSKLQSAAITNDPPSAVIPAATHPVSQTQQQAPVEVALPVITPSAESTPAAPVVEQIIQRPPQPTVQPTAQPITKSTPTLTPTPASAPAASKVGFAFGAKPSPAVKPTIQPRVQTANVSQLGGMAKMPEKRSLNAAVFKKPAAPATSRSNVPYVPQRQPRPAGQTPAASPAPTPAPTPATVASAPAAPVVTSAPAQPTQARVVPTRSGIKATGTKGFGRAEDTLDGSMLPEPSFLQQQGELATTASTEPVVARGTLAGPEREAWLKSWKLDEGCDEGDIPY